MAGMIEQSIISKLLEGGSLDVLHTNSVSPEMFLTCGDEIAFILKHYEEYKQVPDKITFLSEFREFQMLEVSESKIENLAKGKIRYALLKLRLEIRLKKLVPEEAYDGVAEELDELNSMLEGKLDGSLEEAIQKEIDIQNY